MMMNASGRKDDPTLPAFGVIQLALRSPSPVEPDITMKISAEATLPDMLHFFETFLRSAGYMLDSEDALVVQSAKYADEPEVSNLDSAGNTIFWKTPEPTISFYNTPADFTQGANGSTEPLVY